MNLSVLILEDERIRAEVMRSMLASIGACNVYIANSAINAINAAREMRPDIALLDIRMDYPHPEPSLDGAWAAKWIGTLGVPIAFVTAWPEQLAEHHLDLVDTIGYEPIVVAKPVAEAIELERAILETLKRSLGARQDKTSLTDRNGIFVSYSHSDEGWCDWLFDHLKYWAKEYNVELWVDRHSLDPGDTLSDEMINGISRARVGLPLISDAFLGSRAIRSIELPSLLAAKEKGMMLIPIIVEPCKVKEEKILRALLALNPSSKALSQITAVDRERYWLNLICAIDRKFRTEDSSQTEA